MLGAALPLVEAARKSKSYFIADKKGPMILGTSWTEFFIAVLSRDVGGRPPLQSRQPGSVADFNIKDKIVRRDQYDSVLKLNWDFHMANCSCSPAGGGQYRQPGSVADLGAGDQPVPHCLLAAQTAQSNKEHCKCTLQRCYASIANTAIYTN